MDISNEDRETIEEIRSLKPYKAGCLFLQKIYDTVMGITKKKECCCGSVERRILHKDFFDWYDARLLADLKSRGRYTSLA